jgi:hypothetical protein
VRFADAEAFCAALRDPHSAVTVRVPERPQRNRRDDVSERPQRGALNRDDTLDNGRYRLIEQIAQGPFATTWHGFDQRANREVAIKVLHSRMPTGVASIERPLHSARTMARLHHDAIVRVFSPHVTDGNYHYSVMELVRGGPLSRAVIEGRTGADKFLEIVFALAMTAAFVLHGDSLPARIVRDPAEFIRSLPCAPEVAEILAQAVKREPSERYVDANAFTAALQSAHAVASRHKAADRRE